MNKTEKKLESLKSRVSNIGKKARSRKSIGEAAVVGVVTGRATGHWLGKRAAQGKSTNVPYLNISAPKVLGGALLGAGMAGVGSESTNLKLVVAGTTMLAVDQAFTGYSAELAKAAAAAGAAAAAAAAQDA